VNWISGETEGLERQRTEERRTSDRSRGEQRRALSAARSHPNFAKRIDDALPAGELRLPLLERTKLQLRHDVRRQERVHGAGIDERIEGHGPVARLRSGEGVPKW
jgi:hypothetical protein